MIVKKSRKKLRLNLHAPQSLKKKNYWMDLKKIKETFSSDQILSKGSIIEVGFLWHDKPIILD